MLCPNCGGEVYLSRVVEVERLYIVSVKGRVTLRRHGRLNESNSHGFSLVCLLCGEDHGLNLIECNGEMWAVRRALDSERAEKGASE